MKLHRRQRHLRRHHVATRSFWRRPNSLALIAGVIVVGAGGASTGLLVASSTAPLPRYRVIVATEPRLLPAPKTLAPLGKTQSAGQGAWRATGRTVGGRSVISVTTLAIPDEPGLFAGVAWMDTRRIVGQQYSGSMSPGGLGWHYTSPIQPAAAATLIAAFSGGFLMKDTHGGYLSEGKLVAPLVSGDASLVIYKNGDITVGSWGRDVRMTPNVASVRQNLTLLIDHGVISPTATSTDTQVWGTALHYVPDVWRSGIGVTSDGALVYAYGQMNVLDLANVLKDAGAVRAMVLDMNPAWPNFAIFTPADPAAPATPANGAPLLGSALNSPLRFFSSSYARDFITISARPPVLKVEYRTQRG